MMVVTWGGGLNGDVYMVAIQTSEYHGGGGGGSN